jgi:hypothetical protein
MLVCLLQQDVEVGEPSSKDKNSFRHLATALINTRGVYSHLFGLGLLTIMMTITAAYSLF